MKNKTRTYIYKVHFIYSGSSKMIYSPKNDFGKYSPLCRQKNNNYKQFMHKFIHQLSSLITVTNIEQVWFLSIVP